MRPEPDPVPLGIRLLNDVTTLAVLALIVVPGYLLLNHFWRSLVVLLACYGFLGLVFLRLGWYMRRIMRRLPAEIPPWRTAPRPSRAPRSGDPTSYPSSDMLRRVRKDPHYLQDVIKPRLRQLVTYRVSGSLDHPFETLSDAALAQVDSELLEFLSRREPTSLWATYRYRTQRQQTSWRAPIRSIMQIPEAAKQSRHLLEMLQQVIIGKETALQHILLGIYSGGNVLIEDVPGVAKTLMARLIAQVTGLDFKRIQFTPDLLPGDMTGGLIYNQKVSEFEFRPGPLFTNLVLADEVNRAPPKTQAALLEVMQERQVTIEGTTYPMRAPFVVVATQNPIELEGTYPLPEAQLDRFMIRVRVGYPNPEEERLILSQRGARQREQIDLKAEITAEQLLQIQGAVEQVHTSEAVEHYIVSLTAATREHHHVQIGVSPVARPLYQLTRVCNGARRDFVLPMM